MSVKYVNRLDEDQLLEAIRLIAPNATKLSVTSRGDTCIMVEVESPIIVDGEEQTVYDTYDMTDYDFAPYDWSGNIYDEVIAYRHKMHDEFGFGEQYALDYLFDSAD